MTVSINGTSGLVFQDGRVQGNAGYTGFRNRIINGAFDIWQRGTSRTFLTGSGTTGYLADRWCGGTGYQQGAHQRVACSGTTGLRSLWALRAGSSTTAEASGGTRIDLNQKIENMNCYDLAGQVVTLSFWIRFSAASATSSTATAFGNFGVRLQQNTTTTDTATVSDLGDSTMGVTTVTGTAAVITGSGIDITNGSLPTSWTKYTMTGTLSASLKNVTPRFEFSGLGNTAAADGVWYEIAEVQLEQGATATEFERRPWGLEYTLCRRYLQHNTVYGSFPSVGSGFTRTGIASTFNSASAESCVINFNTPMRGVPTMVYTRPGHSTGNANSWAAYQNGTGWYYPTSATTTSMVTENMFSAMLVSTASNGSTAITEGGWAAHAEF